MSFEMAMVSFETYSALRSAKLLSEEEMRILDGHYSREIVMKRSNGINAKFSLLPNNSFHGEYTEEYPNGMIAVRCHYRNDKKEGESVEYYPNGNVMRRGIFANGVEFGATELFDVDGNPVKRLAPLKSERSAVFGPKSERSAVFRTKREFSRKALF